MTSQERERAVVVPETSVADFTAQVGRKLGASPWIVIDQARIDRFADVTGDRQFIHVDPVAARERTPFGGTIAHGFLTLSLLSAMGEAALPKLAGSSMVINYGFEKVRFLSPVPGGSRVRGVFTLAELGHRSGRELLIRYDAEVEIEGQERLALAAEWLVLAVF